MPSVLFVCLGNICRSPAAVAILNRIAKEKGISNLIVDSCGMSDRQIGKSPDARMSAAAEKRGYHLEGRSKPFEVSYFDEFDLILASDHDIQYWLRFFARSDEDRAKISLICDFSANHKGEDVPDPYYGGREHFEEVIDLLEDACKGIIEHLYMI